MLFRLYVCIILFQIISANANRKSKESNDINKETEAIFAGVIKNITRVNSVLQELIHNYEHLQKIYKSQEDLDSESTDGEIDEVFKNKNSKGGRARSKSDEISTPKDEGYPATQMIWSENENHRESDHDESYFSDSENTSKASEKEPIITPKHKKAEIIFVDTHKSTTTKKKPNIEPILEMPTRKPPKSRYSKISKHGLKVGSQNNKNKKQSPKKENNTKKPNEDKNYEKKTKEKTYPQDNPKINNSKSVSEIPNTDSKRNVEKKLQAETFTPMKIWDEIISNKPIELQAHSELTFEKMRKDNSNTSNPVIIQRSEDILPILLNDTNKNKTENPKKVNSKSSDTEEDKGKEEFQATVLREAYGDACLKVVVKKCYKACKAAGKEVCKTHKCKATYKEKFKEYTKTGCIQEFRGKSKKNSDEVNASYGRLRGAGELIGGMTTTDYPIEFDDITRNGYLRSCLPHLQAGYRRSAEIYGTGNETPTYPLEVSRNFNILRDKYERACQKISKTKCNNACCYSYNKVCESFTCNKDRRNAYKKQCKKHCQIAYSSSKSRSSRESSESSGDSESSDSSNSS